MSLTRKHIRIVEISCRIIDGIAKDRAHTTLIIKCCTSAIADTTHGHERSKAGFCSTDSFHVGHGPQHATQCGGTPSVEPMRVHLVIPCNETPAFHVHSMLFARDPVPEEHALLLSLQIEHAYASWGYLAVHGAAVDFVLMFTIASLVFLNGDGEHGCCLQDGSVGSNIRHVLGVVAVFPKQASQLFVEVGRDGQPASTIFLVLLEGLLDLLIQQFVLIRRENVVVDIDALGECLRGLWTEIYVHGLSKKTDRRMCLVTKNNLNLCFYLPARWPLQWTGTRLSATSSFCS